MSRHSFLSNRTVSLGDRVGGTPPEVFSELGGVFEGDGRVEYMHRLQHK